MKRGIETSCRDTSASTAWCRCRASAWSATSLWDDILLFGWLHDDHSGLPWPNAQKLYGWSRIRTVVVGALKGRQKFAPQHSRCRNLSWSYILAVQITPAERAWAEVCSISRTTLKLGQASESSVLFTRKFAVPCSWTLTYLCSSSGDTSIFVPSLMHSSTLFAWISCVLIEIGVCFSNV